MPATSSPPANPPRPVPVCLEQPWRFVYAERDGEHWPRFLDLLSERNRRWAEAAAGLIVVLRLCRFEPATG